MIETNSSKTNPAKRLSNLVQPYTRDKGYAHPNTETDTVLKAMFDISDSTEMYVKLGSLHELIDDVLEVSKPVPLHDSISKVLNVAKGQLNPYTKWQDIKNTLNAPFWNSIDTVSMILDTQQDSVYIQSQELNEEDLTELKQEISVLQEKIISSEIDQHLKQHINRHIKRILDAIDDYRITGNLPILEAVEGMCGHVVMQSAGNEQYQEQIKETGLFDTISKFNDSFSFISTMQPLLSHAVKLLGN
ncbi:conserved hypothetical protein [Vibrio chagasii]|nr:conserved hypothetical protein [Vibrio chagasii]CAH6893230.1 conserved hypothetical protein [Vibrio chagasii]CAH7248827.1 conserved hypothetical protein [Vibrio chagasii]CAH7310182.1 conserved hypothetical protein [Vibrio chagasii]CAH7408656.1 conserved hypothetical protein [Vibrio chagasii]